jgi:hypothetical protein
VPLSSLPELAALDSTADGVRIPPDVTVPLTPRVRQLLDTAEMRRLSRVSQLGLVSLVYPGATHSRFEHSLGVYRLALEFLRRLARDERFVAAVDEHDAAAFLAAALLHDVGHWAFCHPIEDMGLEEVPRHESLVPRLMSEGRLGRVLAESWSVDPARVAALITGSGHDQAARILKSLLSGPVDVDKMDYLERDSLHAGVPYGRHFDRQRLLSSLCLDQEGTSLGIDEKGRTAAELMVFARYVMFSEVYWHHAVRSATSMLQRAVWVLRDRLDPAWLTRSDDASFVAWLRQAAGSTRAAPLADGLFGPERRLFKRVASFDAVRCPEVHNALAGRPYGATAAASSRLADALTRRLGIRVAADELLIDAPPAEREVEFHLQVRERPMDGGRSGWRSLAELSPVVRSLAREQFDDLVKRVRIFAHPPLAQAVAGCAELEKLVLDAAIGPTG